MAAAAEEEPQAEAWVDPDDPAFFQPPDMPEAVRAWCRATGQPVPETRAAVVRCILESLALKCRLVLEELAELLGRPPSVLHVVGGGSRNRLLCRLTADAAGLPVVAGPAEATAAGNVLVQARAAGTVGSLAEGRAVVRRSFPLERFAPSGEGRWEEARARFRALCAGGAGSGGER
jgi:rhamnulokinase